MSSMINKDLLAGMRIEMKSLGVYVPKPAEEAAPAPAAEDVPASAAAAAAPAAAVPAAVVGGSNTPAANGADGVVADTE